MSNTITADSPWIPTTETFAARLALVRQRMGWNWREASQECGLAINAWARFEDGSLPRDLPAVVKKVAARTGVDRDWLMWGGPTDYNPASRPAGRKSAGHHRRPSGPPARSDARRPHVLPR